MKAIETIYNGYRCRSRLEARWMVFFDTLGVRYIYEREGFDFGEAGWYLPDFWLPDFESWLEIKPDLPSPQEDAKARALAKHTGKLVFMFYDCLLPEIRDEFYEDGTLKDVIIRNYGHYYAPDGDRDGMMAFDLCPDCSDVTLGHHGSHYVLCNEAYEHYKGDCKWHGAIDLHNRTVAAYTAARQARFEHGDRR